MNRYTIGDVEKMMEYDTDSYILIDNREVLRFAYGYKQLRIDSSELEGKFSHLMIVAKSLDNTWDSGGYKHYKNVNVE